MRNPEITRNLIISKSVSIFNTKGYRATSLSDITKATGITKGAIYGNFENKDAVAVAAFDYAVKKITGELGIIISSQPTAPLKLKAIIEYYEKYIDNPPVKGGCPLINTSVEADDTHPKLRKKVIETTKMIKASITKIVNRGIKENQLREGIDAELYSTMFYAAIKGAILMARAERDMKSYALIKKGLEMQIEAISI